jgi:hypothetical protein
LQTHASIVEAIAETLSAEADESLDDGGVKASNKYSLLVGQIKDAAAGVDQLRNINVSHQYSSILPVCTVIIPALLHAALRMKKQTVFMDLGVSNRWLEMIVLIASLLTPASQRA